MADMQKKHSLRLPPARKVCEGNAIALRASVYSPVLNPLRMMAKTTRAGFWPAPQRHRGRPGLSCWSPVGLGTVGFSRGSQPGEPTASEIAGKSPLKVIQVFNHYPETTKQLQTHTSLVERLVRTETVIHKFTKIRCSAEQCDSSADRSNISIQTGFGAEAINIPAIFPASEHKDSFTVLIK